MDKVEKFVSLVAVIVHDHVFLVRRLVRDHDSRVPALVRLPVHGHAPADDLGSMAVSQLTLVASNIPPA